MGEQKTAFKSRMMKNIFNKIRTVAPSTRPIVLIGEFGSGKGWLAKKIHELSPRSNKPFVQTHCYALEPKQIHKKIFGHLSFTDSSARINRGAFERANEGTLFFDGFDHLPQSVMDDVINSIKDKKIHHVGSNHSISSDIRFIASFHVGSLDKIRKNRDIIDKLFKLDPCFIHQPPLRKRREDISPLINTFLTNEFSDYYESQFKEISPKALYQCISYTWPGNTRQLKNAIEHAAIISGESSIQPEHLPLSVKMGQPKPVNYNVMQGSQSFRRAEKNLVENLIEETDSVTKTAYLLGFKESELKQKVKKYQIAQELHTHDDHFVST